jgi:hypothetical protein
MQKMLLAVFLLLPAPVFAGPPEGVSGKMVLDEVGDGLRKYWKETDPDRRATWLRRLAWTHDPRVAVALGEAIDSREEYICQVAAGRLMALYYPDTMCCGGVWREAYACWHKDQADLRRRAKQLP